MVEYREITCKSALNRVRGMPFAWSLNPYRGCAHGCHYCFARPTHRFFELGIGDDFTGIIYVKRNLAEVLAGELSRPAWRREQVALGTATDPYQPAEGRYRLTRAALEQFARFPHARLAAHQEPAHRARPRRAAGTRRPRGAQRRLQRADRRSGDLASHGARHGPAPCSASRRCAAWPMRASTPAC